MRLMIGCLAGLFTIVAGSAQAQEHRFYVDVGVGAVSLHTQDAVIQVNGAPVPGAGASIARSTTFGVALGVFMSEHWAASVLLGVPPTATITATGTLASFGTLGKLKYGPITTTVHRHFFFGPLQPYVGGGVGMLRVLSTEDGAVKNLTVSNSFGPAFHAGTQFVFSEHLGVYVDYKHVWLKTDAQGFRGPVIIAARDVPLNPTVWSSGLVILF